MDFAYRFPVVKGLQASKPYYIAMVPLKLLGRLFGQEEDYVPPEYRSQRRLNLARIPSIKEYILENRGSYVFSALAASVDGQFQFLPSDPDGKIGILEISMDARFMMVDGQHRKAAILEAIEEDPSLKEETISIVFYEDKGLENSQQMFTDLNKHAVKTSNSIAELYDSRDDLAVVTRSVIGRIPFLDQYTDKEKDILGKYSSKFFTLNTFYKANKRILKGVHDIEAYEDFLIKYWSNVSNHILPWAEVERREISKVDLREQYVVTQAIIIQAFGNLGNYYRLHPETNMYESLMGLKKVNWLRQAECWKGRIVSENGKIINSQNSARLASNILKTCIGIPLSEEDALCENKFASNLR